jgi:hypothetical protein
VSTAHSKSLYFGGVEVMNARAVLCHVKARLLMGGKKGL